MAIGRYFLAISIFLALKTSSARDGVGGLRQRVLFAAMECTDGGYIPYQLTYFNYVDYILSFIPQLNLYKTIYNLYN